MNFIHQLRVVFNFDKRVTPTIEYSHGIVFAGGRGSTVERAISIFLLKTLSSPFLSHLLPPPLPLYYPTDPLYIYIYISSLDPIPPFTRFSRCFPFRLCDIHRHPDIPSSRCPFEWAVHPLKWFFATTFARDLYYSHPLVARYRSNNVRGMEWNVKLILTKLQEFWNDISLYIFYIYLKRIGCIGRKKFLWNFYVFKEVCYIWMLCKKYSISLILCNKEKIYY